VVEGLPPFFFVRSAIGFSRAIGTHRLRCLNHEDTKDTKTHEEEISRNRRKHTIHEPRTDLQLGLLGAELRARDPATAEHTESRTS
jgi:hypothetical protein